MARKPSKQPPKGLNAKQRRFVAEYLKDCNASAAYKRAGYSAKGNSAEVNAVRLLRNAQICSEIAKGQAKVIERAEFNAEQVVRQLERMVMFDPRKLFHEDGRPKAVSELDDDTAMVVQGLDVQEQFEGAGDERQFVGYVKKYKLTDRLGAVNTALKMFGKLTEKVEHTGKDGGPIQTQDLSDNDIARRIAFALTRGLKQE